MILIQQLQRFTKSTNFRSFFLVTELSIWELQPWQSEGSRRSGAFSGREENKKIVVWFSLQAKYKRRGKTKTHWKIPFIFLPISLFVKKSKQTCSGLGKCERREEEEGGGCQLKWEVGEGLEGASVSKKECYCTPPCHRTGICSAAVLCVHCTFIVRQCWYLGSWKCIDEYAVVGIKMCGYIGRQLAK